MDVLNKRTVHVPGGRQWGPSTVVVLLETP